MVAPPLLNQLNLIVSDLPVSVAFLFFAVASRDADDEVFRKITAAGYASQKAPEDAFWGARYAIFEGPDGNSIGVMSPIDPDRRRTPPPPPR